MIDNLIAQLIRDEGERLKAYQDEGGVWTVGVGHTGPDVIPYMVITQDRSRDLLYEDIATANAHVIKFLPDAKKELDPVRFAVLVNMTFNMGIDGLLGFHHFLDSLEIHDYDTASWQMLESKWATQVGDRAKRLSQQILTGEWQ